MVSRRRCSMHTEDKIRYLDAHCGRETVPREKAALCVVQLQCRDMNGVQVNSTMAVRSRMGAIYSARKAFSV